MSVEDIFDTLSRDIFPLADDPHNVFLWTIDSFLSEAEERMASLDYRLHARLIWDKSNGVCPAFTIRYSHEYLLWFYKPRLIPVATEARGKFTTVIRSPGRQHSRKPDAAYDMINQLYPDGDRIDVFSRELRLGWYQYGDQVNHFLTS